MSGRVAAQGERALLTLSDLPPGWASGVVPALPARVSPWSSGLAGCVGVPARLAALTPTKVDSPDFTSSDKVLAVEDGVSIYPSAAAAQAEYAAMASTKTISLHELGGLDPRCSRTCSGAPVRARRWGR